MINYNSIKDIQKLLTENGLSMSKSRGQNFLMDQNIKNQIAELGEIKKTDKVWEIGPGLGQLSSILSTLTDDLTLFELDKGFIKILKENFSNVNIVSGDFLETRKIQTDIPDIVFGNLPYNIASRIIIDLIEEGYNKMVFVIQKEVAQRLGSDKNQKDYSIFSILAQAKSDIKIVRHINPKSFYPIPKVVSSVITINRHDRYDIKDYSVFKELIKTAFCQRRKNILNNLSTKYDKNKILHILQKHSIDTNQRADSISIQQYVEISNDLVF